MEFIKFINRKVIRQFKNKNKFILTIYKQVKLWSTWNGKI